MIPVVTVMRRSSSTSAKVSDHQFTVPPILHQDRSSFQLLTVLNFSGNVDDATLVIRNVVTIVFKRIMNLVL